MAPWKELSYRAPALLCLIIGACTYGPAQTRVTIDGTMTKPNSRVFAAAIRTEVFRPPTGLSAFPDGGVQRTDRQSVAFYAGDVDSGTVRALATLAAPSEVWTGFAATLLGWNADAVYAVVTGCAKSDCDTARPTRLTYRIGLDGSFTRLAAEPTSLEHPPNMIARAPGETVYTRLSTNWDTITVRTEDPGPYVARFVLTSSGELVPMSRAK